MINNRNYKLHVVDFFAAIFALIISFFLRFDFSVPKNFYSLIYIWLPLLSITQVLTFSFSSLYDRIEKYTSLFDLYAIFKLVSISCLISFMAILFITGTEGYPRSVLILYFIFNLIFTSLIRLAIRVYFSHFHKDSSFKTKIEKKKVLLLGAGTTGDKICRELLTSFNREYEVIGFADDDFSKHGGMLHGKKIFCSIKDIKKIKSPFEEIIITAPSASGEQLRQIVKLCKNTGKSYKLVPSLNEMIDTKITVANIRPVSYSDLLGRAEVKLDMESIDNLINGKRILITGAGGSIGSELVSQCLVYNPSEILCLDQSEEKIFNLEIELNNLKPSIIKKTILASINNRKEVQKVFIDNQPEIVFHAAAYKHVPIQELHPWTAVKTNIIGTLNLLELSNEYNIEKFILVSTDKAVNPVNVMGATKRIAEQLVQSIDQHSKTQFMAVRFGNVLGSSGSAIPTFQNQINKGGPLTITHPEMTRYFMSLQEASQLILQCASIGKEGEIFLLEMGNPIKILDMAKDLIRLSGLEPNIDIPIVFTGLRPGEKLYEELQLRGERRVNTSHKKIMILKSNDPLKNWDVLKKKIIELSFASEELDTQKIQFLLQQIAPNYQPRILSSNKKNSIYTSDVNKPNAEA